MSTEHKVTNMRKAREAAGVKQEEVARLLNVSQGTISSWESGITLPRGARLAALAQFYGVTTDYLLGISEQQLHQPEKRSMPLFTNPYITLTREEMDELAAEQGVVLKAAHVRELVMKIEAVYDDISSPDTLMLSGHVDANELPTNSRYLIAAAIARAMVTTKAIAIKKFTPKQYRLARPPLLK